MNAKPDKRIDHEMRSIFVLAFSLLEPHMAENGAFLSMTNEYQAMQALHKHFPKMESGRIFALVAQIGLIRATGRRPT
jgi:hypothetical protein